MRSVAFDLYSIVRNNSKSRSKKDRDGSELDLLDQSTAGIRKYYNYLLTLFKVEFNLKTSDNNNVVRRTDQELQTLWPVLAKITLRGVINVNDKISKISSIVFAFHKFLYIFVFVERLTHSLKLFITEGNMVSTPELKKALDGKHLVVATLVALRLELSVELETKDKLMQSVWHNDCGLSSNLSEIWVEKFKVVGGKANNVVNFKNGRGYMYE